MPVTPQRIFEGELLGVADNEKTLLYDWNDLTHPLHKIDFSAEKIWWDEAGEQMAIASQTKFIIFRLNKTTNALSELLTLNDKITSGVFVDKIFYYINKAGKIHLSFLGKSFFFGNAEKKQFILGALDQQERLYLFDKTNSVYSHYVPFELFKQVSNFVQGTLKE